MRTTFAMRAWLYGEARIAGCLRRGDGFAVCNLICSEFWNRTYHRDEFLRVNVYVDSSCILYRSRSGFV